MLRDDLLAYTSSKKDRRRVLKEILSLEETELGISRLESPEEEQRRAREQKMYAQRIAQPLRHPDRVFSEYLRAPRTLRGKGNRSLDVLFCPNRDGTFWLYGSVKVSVTTVGSLGAPVATSVMAPSPALNATNTHHTTEYHSITGPTTSKLGAASRGSRVGAGPSPTFLTSVPDDNAPRRPRTSASPALHDSTRPGSQPSTTLAVSPSPIRRPTSSASIAPVGDVSPSPMGSNHNRYATLPTREEVRRSPIGQQIKRQLDNLMNIAATKERCGLIFDLISTSKLIASGIPHEIGAFIYDYIDEMHFEKVSLKFVFVGITDNANCCAARDVFCRDDVVAGKYVGDTKRPFDALDNVHMYTVFPGHRLHPFSKGVPNFGTSDGAGASSPTNHMHNNSAAAR